MRNSSILIITFLLLMIGIIVGGIGLQIFLSRRQNKYLGLILPFITFLLSIITVLGNTAFSSSISTEGIVTVCILFILNNIPTAILLGIYYACRENLKRKKELEKMNILDLE